MVVYANYGIDEGGLGKVVVEEKSKMSDRAVVWVRANFREKRERYQ